MHGLVLLRLGGVEPPTYGFEVRCSIQLSYNRIQKRVPGGFRTHDNQIHNLGLYR